jgi:hypothetical protein
MRSIDALLIENTGDFNVLVVSERKKAKQFLFPKRYERLQKFRNIESIRSFSEPLPVVALDRHKKLVVFVDVTTVDVAATGWLHGFDKIIYSMHAERTGLFFGFTFDRITDAFFDQLISAGFDDIFELGDDSAKKYMRMYSWIRRLGGNPVTARDAIPYSKPKRIGKWNVFTGEMIARDKSGREVNLTRQETDFLTLLLDDVSVDQGTSYNRLFKAPHAISHNLKKKLGDDLPIKHGGNGRYHLLKEDR